MSRLIKRLVILFFLGIFCTALIVSCGKQAKEGDHPAGEHPADSTEHPKDSTEHPADSTEHPAGSAEHPADTTKN
jgi:hypothetical protein